jgi:hypothetical protein
MKYKITLSSNAPKEYLNSWIKHWSILNDRPTSFIWIPSGFYLYHMNHIILKQASEIKWFKKQAGTFCTIRISSICIVLLEENQTVYLSIQIIK